MSNGDSFFNHGWNAPPATGSRLRRTDAASPLRAVAVLCAALFFAGAALPLEAGALGQGISSETSFMATAANDDYDKFPVTPASGKSLRVSVAVSSGGSVDFYVMDSGDLNQYESPSFDTFTFEDRSENARSYSHSFSASGFTLVVDNAAISEAGATPSGPVTYTVTVTEQDTLGSALLGGIVLLLVVLGGVAFVLMRRKRRAGQLPAVLPGQPPAPQAGQPGYPQPVQAPYPQYPQAPAPYNPQPYDPGQPYNPQPYHPPPYDPSQPR